MPPREVEDEMSGAWAERATDAVSRVTPLVLRFSAGFLWLSNVGWKRPPDFRLLEGYVQRGIDHPVAPVYPWVLDNVIQPNLTAFGWVTLLVEFLLAALLLSGTFTRAAAVLGMLQSAAIGLTVANAPEEWYWAYILMVLLHLAIFAMAAGRSFGVDGLIRRQVRSGEEERPPWLEVVTLRQANSAHVRDRITVAVLTAAYGVLVVVSNLRNAWLTNDFTRRAEVVLFGGDSGFPGDFGRAVFAGTVTLGLLFVVLAVLVVLWGGTPLIARAVGAAAAAFSILLILTYREDGNLLGARPSAAAVLLAVALYLLASSLTQPSPEADPET